MKKLLILIFLLPLFAWGQTDFCRVYTAHAPIKLTGAHDITISGDSISGGSSPCIWLVNCQRIRITKCKIYNCTSGNGAIYIQGGDHFNIDTNNFEKVSTGVYAESVPNGAVVVKYNHAKNMMGPYPRGAFVQFNRVGTITDASYVGHNEIQNFAGASNPEDCINMYLVNGTASAPVLIEYNDIRGGGPSTTGSGITIGDGPGPSSYVTVQNNTMIYSGHVGIQTAGGTHMVIQNNRIFSISFPWSGVGLGSHNFTGLPSATNNTITGNYINWIEHTGFRRDTTYGGANGNQRPSGWSSNFVASSAVNNAMLPDPLWGTCAVPAIFTYPSYTYIFTYGTSVSPIVPFVSGGSMTSYSVSPALPAGLALNTTTGIITGAPTNVVASATYTVTGHSSGGTSTFPLTITVNKKNLSITAVNLNKRVGQVNPTLRVAYSDWAPGDSPATLDTPPTITTTAVTGSLQGVYDITVSGAASTKYAITYFNGKLNVSNGLIINGIYTVGH